MKKFIQLGTAPSNEDCVQTGSKDYQERSRIEASIHINQLQRCFKRIPKAFNFGMKKFNHDFGEYIDVVLYYGNSDTDENRAYAIQDKLPVVWDSKAIEELLVNEQLNNKTIADVYSKETTELRKAIDKVEAAGGFVMLDVVPDENEISDFSEDGEIIKPIEEPETSAISVDATLKMHGINTDDENDLEELF
jgi:hypothetical protein